MTTPRSLAIVGLGELLWDELPGGRRLGGAPANFAVMAARLGAHGILASRLGADPPGRDARAELATLPVDLRFLQCDPAVPTGRVSVTLQSGQPSYVIHQPSAWDALELTPGWRELAARADAVCWGSLAQRDPRSRATIAAFLAATRPGCLRVFDINLRQQFATPGAVRQSLAHATLLKLNDSEMPLLLTLAALNLAPEPSTAVHPDLAAETSEQDFVPAARRILSAYPSMEMVAVTLGAHGSLLVTPTQALRHPGVHAVVADAVGAGDAFTAALVTHRLQGASLAVQAEAANRWGAWVASQPGAMPPLDEPTRATIERRIAEAAR